MEWFIKCIKHYSDFSGRARRKEYWMFLLFYLIFAVVWASLVAVIFSITYNYVGLYEFIKDAFVALITYSALLTLPSIAVSVRRIRDVGLSGWLILAILIPNIAGIWLRNNMTGNGWTIFALVLQFVVGIVWLTLMATEGSLGKNKYGENPKTSPSTLNEKIMLRGTSITLIVASVLSLATTVYFLRMLHSFGVSTIPYISYIRLASNIIILISAIFLLNIKSINELFTKGKKVFILMLPAMALNVVNFILVFNSAVSRGNVLSIFSSVTQLFLWLSLAFLLVSILFFWQHKKYIRIAVLSVIVLAIGCLLLNVYSNVIVGHWRLDTRNILHSYASIRYVAYIMLASIFLVQKEIMPESIKRIFSKCQ